MFNNLVKVSRLLKKHKDIAGFNIVVESGDYRTKKLNKGYNYYKKRYTLYINDSKIPYGVYYQEETIASLSGISLYKLKSYYNYKL